jgi:DNA polymerase I-like protein with 3'-5' exonuclease and polymerase domains
MTLKSLSASKELIFDIEADGLTPNKIWCIVTKDIHTKAVNSFGPDELQEGIKHLQSANTLIGHNILGYDLPALEKLHNFTYKGKIIDTLVLSRLFQPVRENGHSLKTWGYRVNYHKAEQPDDFDSYNPEMLKYCQQDVMLNEIVFQHLDKESRNFSSESMALEHQVAKVMVEQEKTRFLFNVEKASMLLAELKTRMTEVEDEVQKTFKPKWVEDKLVTPYVKKDGQLSVRGLTKEEYEKLLKSGNYEPFMRKKLVEFNLGSRKQIGEYLEDFGWKPEKFTPTGQPIVDEGTLKKINHIHEARLIAEFLLLQKRIAQISSWIDELQGERVHGRVIPNGTITGRMTHRSPNMAQVPSIHTPYGQECRACWIVPEGYKLLGIDASGLELRVLAHYMQDDDYIDEVINGDIHTTNQNLAGLQTRDNAKTFIYALIYGAGDAKIGKIINSNKVAGERLKNRFLKNLPALEILTNRVRQAAQRGFLKGLDGRKIFVRNGYAALNTLLQGGGAIVMKKAMCLLHQKIKTQKLEAQFVANIHDEWQIQVKEDIAELVGEMGVESIEEAGQYYKMRCPLTGEYKIGENWSETH